MNICIVTSSYPLNLNDGAAAAGFFIRDFALLLSEAGHKVYVLTQARRGPIEDDGVLRVVRYKWVDDSRPLSALNPFNPRDILKILILIKNGKVQLFKLIQKEKIDFCLAMWAVPAGYLTYLAQVNLKTPYAVWALGSDIWSYAKAPFFKAVIKKVLAGARSLFADGYQLAEMVEMLSKKKCAFLSSARLMPAPKEKAALDKNKRNFIFIGRYHKHKGLDVLIEAVNLIPREVLPGMNFHIFGGGNLEEMIRGRIREYGLGKYIFVNGFINTQKAADYLSACDCLIVPSRIESIPLILSDSLQIGCPVIVTDVGDMGVLVRKYNAGRVVSSDNPEQLKEAIVSFKSEDFMRYRQGMEKLRGALALEKNVKEFLQAIEYERI